MKQGFHLTLLIFVIAFFYLAEGLNVGYYTKADYLGPVSKFPTVFILLAALIALVMTYAFKTATREPTTKCRALISLLPLVLLLLYMLFLPDAIEKYSLTNFKDAVSHMVRTEYVIQTGAANPKIDPYFDLQPGVFYSMAAYILITDMPPDLILRWFPLFFVSLVYVPALIFLGKSFFKNPRDLAMFAFLVLIVNWPPSRYHYSAQTYSLVLFVIVMGLVTRDTLDRKRMAAAILVSAAIIPIHQGVSLFLLAAFIGILLAKGIDRLAFHREWAPGSLLQLTVIFSVIWISYQAWLAAHTVGMYLSTIESVITMILGEPLTQIVGHAIFRPDPMYQTLVYAKSFFTAAVFLLGSAVLAYMWLRRGTRKSRDLLATIVAVGTVAYILGFILGGAGYVERAVLMTSPFLGIGLTVVSRWIGKKKSLLPLAVMLIVLTITGTVLFNSERNFQVVLFSEEACGMFFPPYSDLGNLPGGKPLWYDANEVGRIPRGVFVVEPWTIIQSSIWVPEDLLSNAITALDQRTDAQRFYSNGVCSMYWVS